jgi:hypothetical protein
MQWFRGCVLPWVLILHSLRDGQSVTASAKRSSVTRLVSSCHHLDRETSDSAFALANAGNLWQRIDLAGGVARREIRLGFLCQWVRCQPDQGVARRRHQDTTAKT